MLRLAKNVNESIGIKNLNECLDPLSDIDKAINDKLLRCSEGKQLE